MSEPDYPLNLNPKNPSILQIILTLFHVRHTGEDDNILALFQALVGALSGRAFIIAIKGATSAGKSRLAKTVLAPFAKLELVMHYSRVTATYLEYRAIRQLKMDQEKEDPLKKDTFEMTVPPILYIDELKGASAAIQSLKIIYSEGKIVLGTVIKGRPIDIILKGVRVIVTTTANPAFEDPEFENRLLPLQIDETQSQTRRVLDYQGEEGESLEEEDEEDEVWLASKEVDAIAGFVKQLKPVRITIPFAGELAKRFPDKHVWARRDFPKVKRIIRNITTIHQYRRIPIRNRKTLSVGVAADPEDLDYAVKIGLPALTESLTGISLKEKEVYTQLCEASPNSKIQSGTLEQEEVEDPGWTLSQLTKALGLAIRKEASVYKLLRRMTDDGYVNVDKGEKAFRYKPSGLQPESLDLKLKEYQSDRLEGWAKSKGYEIGPFSEASTPENVKVEEMPSNLELSELRKNEPTLHYDSEFQRRTSSTSEIQNEMIGNSISSTSTVLSKSSDGDFSPSDKPELPSDKPQSMSDKPSDTGASRASHGPMTPPSPPPSPDFEREIPGLERPLYAPQSRPDSLETSDRASDADSSVSDTKNGTSDSREAEKPVSQEELRLVRQAFRDEAQRVGYGHMAKIRYQVREKILDPNRVTRIVAMLAKNGELSPVGADCFKLRSQSTDGIL